MSNETKKRDETKTSHTFRLAPRFKKACDLVGAMHGLSNEQVMVKVLNAIKEDEIPKLEKYVATDTVKLGVKMDNDLLLPLREEIKEKNQNFNTLVGEKIGKIYGKYVAMCEDVAGDFGDDNI